MSKPNVADIYPLSPLQEGMLFHSRLAPRSGAYLEQAALRVRGPMQPETYARAWQAVVDLHPALRTSFAWENVARPLQLVHRSVTLPTVLHDWRGLPAAEREARLAELRVTEQAAGFDLAHAPLIRLAVARLDEEWSAAVLTFHHVLLDGWSLGLVLNDVIAAYEALAAGREPRLEAPRPYKEHIAWLARHDAAAAERYWRQALAGLQGATRLGMERPAPPTAAALDEYGRASVRLTRDESEALRSMARRHKMTLGTLMYGAWAVLLSRYAATGDVVFGTTHSGRPADLPGVQRMVGLFINTLPVRVRVDDGAALEPWLHALQDAFSEARQHGYSPLVEVHGWSGVPRDRPLMESLVVLENYPGEEEEGLHPLRHMSGESPERTSYPLAIAVSPEAERLELRATFDARRLDHADVARVLGHWAELLAAMRRGLTGRVGDLPMLPDAEREAVLGAWAGGPTPYPRERTVHALFREQALRTPDAVAVEAEDGRLTYAELDARSDALAVALRRAGIGPEARVGIALERSAGLVVALLATLKAGAAYVPLDLAYPAERTAFMEADSGVSLVVSTEALRPGLPPVSVPVLSLDGGGTDDPATPYEVGALRGVFGDAESLAYVLYTSGSTGRPKGSGIPHRGIVRLVRETETARLGPGDRMAQVASISFDAATWEVWAALLSGATLVVFPRHVTLVPATFAAGLRERRVSVAVLTTSLFNQLAHHAPNAFAAMDHLMVGGEALDPAAIRAVLAAGPPRRLLNVYGPTESTTFAAVHVIGEVPEGAARVPIGRPVANTETYVVDAELRPVPPGVPGELLLGGDGLARGYLGRPALTAERFVPHPFADGQRVYRTGDAARWTGDGTLDFLGRLDGQVKLRGYRVEPGEVEAALCALDRVSAAAVGVRHDGTGERRLVAWVVPAAEAVEAAELRAALRHTLPDWMVPSAFVSLPALPLTPNGKVDRAALPAPEGGEAQAPYVAPRDREETAIAAVFAQVLGVERVGIHDDFFSLGGHSLRAMQVASRLRDALDLEVPLADLFAHPTPAALAARIRAGEDERMAVLLAELEGLSEGEVRAELGETA
jgi:amino acid adenylation domain-containing protein